MVYVHILTTKYYSTVFKMFKGKNNFNIRGLKLQEVMKNGRFRAISEN